MKPNSRVLVIDRDPAMRRLLGILLATTHAKVVWTQTGREGLEQAIEWRPEATVLELDLPDGDGIAVLEALREWSRAPIMVVTRRAATADKVRAFESGANDYLVKPFDGAELLARLRALQRRPVDFAPDAILRDGLIEISLFSRQVTVNGRTVELSATEEVLFQALARHFGSPVSPQVLMRMIWGAGDAARTHELQVYIERLQRKLAQHGAKDVVRSEGRAGYRLVLGGGLEHVGADQAL